MDKGTLDFRNVYNTYQPRTLRYLIRLADEDEAKDLTQEISVKAHQAFGGSRGEASAATWLYRMATNAATDGVVYLSSEPPLRDHLTTRFNL